MPNVCMLSPVGSSALTIANVAQGSDDLKDGCAKAKCLNAITELCGERTDPKVVRQSGGQDETDLGGRTGARVLCDCIQGSFVEGDRLLDKRD